MSIYSIKGIGHNLDDLAEYSRNEVAEQIGLSTVRVSQLEQNALRKLRWKPGTRIKPHGRWQGGVTQK